MRVLIVASRYLPHRGGLETVVRELSHELIRRNHQVIILTNKFPRNLPKFETIDGIPVQRFHFLVPRFAYLREMRFDLWLAAALLFPFTLFRLATSVRQFRADVINLHYLGPAGFFLLCVNSMIGRRLVVSLHGGDVDGEPRKNRFNRWLFRTVLQKADAITVCSQSLLNRATELLPEIQNKAHVVHNGVNLEVFAAARPYKHENTYIFAVGQLEIHKGFDLLIDAFARIASKVPTLDLLIAGDGSQMTELCEQVKREHLSGRVKMLGSVGREEVASFMCGSQTIVIPSRRESFGIVALEARASGRPIIACRVGGLVEALERANVFWFSPGDVQSLECALLRCLSQTRSSSDNYSDRATLEQQYSWNAVADRYLSTYNRAM